MPDTAPKPSRRLLAAAVVLPWLVAALPARAQTLTISAAASLTDAFKAIGTRFEAARPGVTLRFNFAASGVLIQQILQGAPVDVFASADHQTLQRGIDARVLDPATRREFAANALVLVTPRQGGPGLAALADIAQPAVKRVAVGKPATVPVGRYTRQALQTAGLWAAVEPRLVYADSVRQVLDYVARGEVEAGFVYRTDAATQPGKVRIVQIVGGHEPVTCPAAVVADSRQKALATEFVNHLAGPEAQAILARFGFAQVP